MSHRSNEQPPLEQLIEQAVTCVGRYLTARNGRKLVGRWGPPVAPGSDAEKDLLSRLNSAHEAEMDAKESAVAALKALPEPMERAGLESTSVLRLLHYIDGGGGPDAVYGEWPSVKAFLQRAVVRMHLGREEQTENLAPVSPPKARRTKEEWVGAAMICVRDHPDWSDRQVATHVQVSPSSLSRSADYQRAAQIARGSRQFPRGIRNPEDRSLEAYEGGESRGRQVKRWYAKPDAEA